MKAAGRRPCGVEKKLSMTVETAGTCVKVASSTTAGSASSQPCTWIFNGGLVAAIAGLRRPERTLRTARISVLIAGEDAGGFHLRLVERRLGRLGAGQDRLQGIVERLGNALV